MLDQQPVGALTAGAVSLHPDQDPTSMQLLAVEPELQGAFFESFFRRLVALGGPVSAVPDHNRPAAVLAFGNGALEIAILQRVIFYLDREALFFGVERGSAGHCPRFEDTIEFEPEIVMEARRRMLLNHEAPAFRGRDCGVAARLGGFAEIALGLVGRKTTTRHRAPALT